MSHNFILVNCDTDSISICKQDQSSFSKEEQLKLLDELNSNFPEHINWEPDGYFQTVIALRPKNYLLWDGKKAKIKGSSLKSSTKSIALKEFLQEVLNSIITEKYNYKEIYDKYILEALNVKDIKRWASKKTYTDKIDESERLNETKVKDALRGSEYRGGDKFYVFYKSDDTLCLIENFDGDYNKDRLIKQVWDTAQTFETIIDPQTFTKYHLKKNKPLLEVLMKGINEEK